MSFLSGLFQKAKVLTLPAYLCISVALVFLCALAFPDRLGSLLAFINRMFIATVFVNCVYFVQDLDKDSKPLVLAAALMAAGFAV